MRKLNQSDYSWAAGFFEGEGNIYIERTDGLRRSPRFALQITAVNTDPRPLNRLQTLFGGRISEMKRKPETSRSFIWRLWRAGEQRTFLEVILPFLQFKHEEVMLGLAIRKSLDDGFKKRRTKGIRSADIITLPNVVAYWEDLRNRLHKLNEKGKRDKTRYCMELSVEKGKVKDQLSLFS